MATEVEGIDLILSSNQDSDAPETEQIKETRIVYPGSKLDSVGKITLAFDTKTHQLKAFDFTDEPLLKNKYGEDDDIAKQAGVSLATIARKLKEMNCIRYVGSSKKGHWEVDDYIHAL